jgi:phosphatidate phosphatase LPIN
VKELTDKIKPQSNSNLKKTLLLTSDQLKRLNLKSGMNQVEFSVTTALQGTSIVEANIFFFDHLTKFVISDIDGTITK